MVFAMFLVGLTGGFASGKTTIASLFKEQGAIIIDADQLARKVVEPGKAAWKDLVRTFGKTILHEDHTLNRQKLAQIVFSDPEKLQRLNAIIHPRVAREQARLTRQIAVLHPEAVIVYDAALLIEAGAHRRMDYVIVVTAPQPVQLARARRRDGLRRRDALQRIQQQLPFDQKRLHADLVIDGTLPLHELRPIVRRLHQVFARQAQANRTKALRDRRRRSSIPRQRRQRMHSS